MAEANQWVFGLKTLAVAPDVEVLTDPNDPTSSEWDVTGDMADDTGKVTYTHSAAVGTLTQPSAKLVTVGVASVPYTFTYTISATTTPENSTATITSAFASSAVALDLTAGVNTVTFTSAAGAATADFVIDVVSSGTSVWTLDTMTLTHESAESISSSRLEVLDFTIRAEASNTGTITVVGAAAETVGVPFNAGDVGSWSAQESFDTLDISTLFFSASVATDGFHWSYRK